MHSKSIDFSGENIYIGLDVHKRNWSVSILTDQVEHKTFNQPPDPVVLHSYLKRHFPGGNWQSAYEAGFSGFRHHRELLGLGIQNRVVNPSDVPGTGKEKVVKTDRVDSRKIARALRNGSLHGIHVPAQQDQELRSLSRYRHIFMRDLRRYKNRIKSFLMYYGIQCPQEHDYERWSLAFLDWLKGIKMTHPGGQCSLEALIHGLEYHRSQIREVNNRLRALVRRSGHRELYYLLRSIPGIGPLTAICIITEIGDIARFGTSDRLSSFAGLMPMSYSSGETSRTGGMTYRCNGYLRTMIVEASWQAIRKDPAMLQYFKKHAGRGNSKKAIVKVARKLLNRIRYVMKNRLPYEVGQV